MPGAGRARARGSVVRPLFAAALSATLCAPLAAQQDFGCPYNDRLVLSRRASPLDSLTFPVGDAAVKICYGRPSARGRTMIGGDAVPFGSLWRTGANETTKFHTTIPLAIAGIRVEPGTYALYTVPGRERWEIVVNRAWEQWGHERYYTDEVRAQEVGRAVVPAAHTEEHVETFTIRAEPPRGGVTHLVLEWENTRVRIPVRPGGHRR